MRKREGGPKTMTSCGTKWNTRRVLQLVFRASRIQHIFNLLALKMCCKRLACVFEPPTDDECRFTCNGIQVVSTDELARLIWVVSCGWKDSVYGILLMKDCGILLMKFTTQLFRIIDSSKYS